MLHAPLQALNQRCIRHEAQRQHLKVRASVQMPRKQVQAWSRRQISSDVLGAILCLPADGKQAGNKRVIGQFACLFAWSTASIAASSRPVRDATNPSLLAKRSRSNAISAETLPRSVAKEVARVPVAAENPPISCRLRWSMLSHLCR